MNQPRAVKAHPNLISLPIISTYLEVIMNDNHSKQISNFLDIDDPSVSKEIAEALPANVAFLPSEEMARVYKLAHMVAQSPNTAIVISGESGVGKEGIAQLVHKLGHRKGKPFTTVNCASFQNNEQLAHSQIFGHIKGAYTSADRANPGLILETINKDPVLDKEKVWYEPPKEENGGVLFLDEIHALPLAVRSQLIVFLDSYTFRPLGGGYKYERRANIQIIAATNQNPHDALAPMDFRQRLMQTHIHIPPLRERPEDIPELIRNFIKSHNDLHKTKINIMPDALSELIDRKWDGNVRELKKIINQAHIVAASENIELDAQAVELAFYMVRHGDLPEYVEPQTKEKIQLLWGNLSPRELWLSLHQDFPAREFDRLPETEQLFHIRTAAAMLSSTVGNPSSSEDSLDQSRIMPDPISIPNDLLDELKEKFKAIRELLNNQMQGPRSRGRPPIEIESILGAYYYTAKYHCDWDDLKSLPDSEIDYPSQDTYNRFFAEQLYETEPYSKAVADKAKTIPMRHNIENYINEYTAYEHMVRIPAGNFYMGSNTEETEDDAKPQHRVYVAEFSVDQCVVTNEEYQAFVLANPEWRKPPESEKIDSNPYYDAHYLSLWIENDYPKGKGKHPVVYVSWYAAMAYAQWLGKRLPTEAEWEKAARGNSEDQDYPWGNSITDKQANYRSFDRHYTPALATAKSYYDPSSHLYNMVGNVWEWCLDDYDRDYYYKKPEKNNPLATNEGIDLKWLADKDNFTNLDGAARVVTRGGSYTDWRGTLKVFTRNANTRKSTNPTLSFRCVREGGRK